MGEVHLTVRGMAECYLEQAGISTNGEPLLEQIGYFTQPASKGHHLANRGGLVEHCVNVTRRLVELTETLGIKWPRKASPYLVGMLHDLVKCRCYRAVPGTEQDAVPKWEYVQPVYPGHGACSVAIAEELGMRLCKEEIVAITYHMGAFGIGKEYTDKEFDAALKAYAPQIIATHCADWWAAGIDEESEVTA